LVFRKRGRTDWLGRRWGDDRRTYFFRVERVRRKEGLSTNTREEEIITKRKFKNSSPSAGKGQKKEGTCPEIHDGDQARRIEVTDISDRRREKERLVGEIPCRDGEDAKIKEKEMERKQRVRPCLPIAKKMKRLGPGEPGDTAAKRRRESVLNQ